DRGLAPARPAAGRLASSDGRRRGCGQCRRVRRRRRSGRWGSVGGGLARATRWRRRRVIDEEIPGPLAGERVDRVVAMLTDCTRSEAAAAIAAGAVLVDGRVVTKPSQRLHEGQRLEVTAEPHAEAPLPQPDPGVVVPVVYEDEHVIVVDK